MNKRIKEVKQKQRHVANAGDLIGIYGDEKKEFKLAIALGRYFKRIAYQIK